MPAIEIAGQMTYDSDLKPSTTMVRTNSSIRRRGVAMRTGTLQFSILDLDEVVPDSSKLLTDVAEFVPPTTDDGAEVWNLSTLPPKNCRKMFDATMCI